MGLHFLTVLVRPLPEAEFQVEVAQSVDMHVVIVRQCLHDVLPQHVDDGFHMTGLRLIVAPYLINDIIKVERQVCLMPHVIGLPAFLVGQRVAVYAEFDRISHCRVFI